MIGHAVDQVVVGADTAAAQRNDRGIGLVLLPVELRVARRRERRHGDPDQKGVAAGRGQRVERRLVQHAAGGRRGRVDERRLAGDGDVLRNRANLEQGVERDELLRPDDQPLRFVFLYPVIWAFSV